MKNRIFITLGVGFFVAVFLSSCLPTVVEDNQTIEEERRLLNEYITTVESEGTNVDTTALGVYYIVKEASDGIYPQMGDTLTISYKGYLMNGLKFDDSAISFENGTWTFILGETQVVAGWNDGMMVVNEGAKVQLMIPSELGYGEYGYSTIPPNNTLIFIVEMIEIKQKI